MVALTGRLDLLLQRGHHGLRIGDLKQDQGTCLCTRYRCTAFHVNIEMQAGDSLGMARHTRFMTASPAESA